MSVAIFIVGLYYFLKVVELIRQSKRDSTDQKKTVGKKRSGLILYTDHGTGVQYVASIHGGLTPRLKEDGTLHSVGE